MQQVTVIIDPAGFVVGNARKNDTKSAAKQIAVTAEVTAGGPGGAGCIALVEGVLGGLLPRDVAVEQKDDGQESIILGLVGVGR